jgi:chemotaxis protein CheD
MVLPEGGGVIPNLVRERRFLQPGHLLVSAQPVAITTILGSCIAVCIWDPGKRVGGMNHFMLPMAATGASASPRFGNSAMEELVKRLRDAGGRLPFLRARVYGGACMFAGMQSADHLGRKNADVAMEFLRRSGIDVVEVEVGGNRGRKLIFNTDEGTACLTTI